jgi:alginate O-acetyltransferase complex protein AlgI
MSQFLSKSSIKIDYKLLAAGVSLFSLGLAKKVIFADTLADFANPVFNNAESGISPKFFESWGAALAYTFQLYFDFSAYSDMAIGISLMFGIRLPANFNSPYKSTNIIDFWRRWHMTLSRFLKDYLYIPLGGNQAGPIRKYTNIFITMALGGLWHGASWTFLLWGIIHGTLLIINHCWRTTSLASKLLHVSAYKYFSWLITFFAVVIGWVVFRSESFAGSYLMLKAMLNFSTISIPPQIFGGASTFLIPDQEWSGALGGIRAILVIFLCFPFVLLLPNLQQVFSEYKPTTDNTPPANSRISFRWHPSLIWASMTGLVLGLSVTRFGLDSNFLYFNF